MNFLKLALIHFNVRHKEPKNNRERLLALVEKAARQGAKMVITPELGLSGYSFSGHKDIEPYAETEEGFTLTSLSETARRLGIHVCVGMAEKDSCTGMIFNSAFVLDARGNRICRYRKINAESRWACPGDPRQNNTFATPWGRMGVLICSDTYHGLMPRVTALRGANLLIVPANWPPSGLDPRELWRARALENGFYLAGCNRTGKDLIMDCGQAPTVLFTPFGEALLDEYHENSRTFFVEVPLNADGRLDHRMRLRRLAGRSPRLYHDCYLNYRAIRDLTQFLELPCPGILDCHVIVPHGNEHPVDALERNIRTDGIKQGSLHILAMGDLSDGGRERIREIVQNRNMAVLSCEEEKGTGNRRYLFQKKGDMKMWELPPWPFEVEGGFPCMDYGTARLLMAPFSALSHPELAVSAAKKGCDLVVACESIFAPEDRLLAGARTTENVAVAVCARNCGAVWDIPQGHERWNEVDAGAGEVAHYALDTRRTRQKRFQDNIDFQELLRHPVREEHI